MTVFPVALFCQLVPVLYAWKVCNNGKIFTYNLGIPVFGNPV